MISLSKIVKKLLEFCLSSIIGSSSVIHPGFMFLFAIGLFLSIIPEMSSLTFFHRTDPYQTHQPVLYEMAMRTDGPIIEFGCGYGSTDLLHELCRKNKRLLISLDDDAEWLNRFKEKYREDSEWHRFFFVSGKPFKESDSAQHWIDFMNTCDLLQTGYFDICFIDQHPWQARVETVKFMKDKAKFFVLHDCDYFPTVGLFGTTIIPNVHDQPGVFDFSDIFRYFEVYVPFCPWPKSVGPPTLVGSDIEGDFPVINFSEY